MKNQLFINSNSNRIDKLVRKFQGYVVPPSKTKIKKYLGNFDGNADAETGLKLLEKIEFFDNQRTNTLLKVLYDKLQRIGKIDNMLILPIDPASGSSSYRMIEKFRCKNKLKAAKYDPVFPSGFRISLLESLSSARNKNVIFLDDLVASGSSFRHFYEDIGGFPDDTCKYYVGVITAHREGIEFIKSYTPAKVISATSSIPYTKKILHPNNTCFTSTEQKNLKKYCRKLQVKKEYLFGFKEMASPVIFYEKTPNNALPLLYHQQPNWNAVFKN